MRGEQKLWSLVRLLGWGLLIALMAFVFRNESLQSANWSFPYFSGAANFERPFDWRISPSEFEKVSQMSVEEHRSYRYVATSETIPNTINSYGYVLVALAARSMFFWVGDIQSVIMLQVLVHIGISLLFMAYLLESRLQRGLFFVLYAVNPLVLHVATFPFYYFWTVLPSAALAVVWFKPEKIGRWLPFLAALLLLSLLIRPTTLFVALLVFGVAFWRDEKRRHRRAIACVAGLFVVGLLFVLQQGGQRSLFHTFYIGVGAYSNPYGIQAPVDEEGYRFFYEETGKTISTDPIHGNLGDPEVLEEYDRTLRQGYKQILFESPLLLIRNALLNTVQAFGVGYNVDRPGSRPLTVAIGLLVLGLFAIFKQWVWGAGVLAYAAAFTPYFPPIPAYLFGAYLLLAIGATMVLERIALGLGWGPSDSSRHPRFS